MIDYFLNDIPDKAIGTNGLGAALNLAARQGWTAIVAKHIVRDSLAIHQRGWIGETAMHWTCHIGYADIVTLLLDNGADITLQEANGKTALDIAKEKNNTKIISVLSN